MHAKRYSNDAKWQEAAGRITCGAINALERECIAPVDYEVHYTEFIEYAAAEVYPDSNSNEFVELSKECHMRVARDIETRARCIATTAILMSDPVAKAIVEAVTERLINRRGIRREVALEGAQSWITREMVSGYVDLVFEIVRENEGW